MFKDKKDSSLFLFFFLAQRRPLMAIFMSTLENIGSKRVCFVLTFPVNFYGKHDHTLGRISVELVNASGRRFRGSRRWLPCGWRVPGKTHDRRHRVSRPGSLRAPALPSERKPGRTSRARGLESRFACSCSRSLNLQTAPCVLVSPVCRFDAREL